MVEKTNAPNYVGIVHNEQTSDGSGLVVLNCNSDGLEGIVRDVLIERTKDSIEWELHYRGKPNDFDYTTVPEYVQRHIKRKDNTFLLDHDEDIIENELGINIQYGDGFMYHVEVYDLKNANSELKSQLAQLEQNKFIFLHEIDGETDLGLKDQFGLIF